MTDEQPELEAVTEEKRPPWEDRHKPQHANITD